MLFLAFCANKTAHIQTTMGAIIAIFSNNVKIELMAFMVFLKKCQKYPQTQGLDIKIIIFRQKSFRRNHIVRFDWDSEKQIWHAHLASHNPPLSLLDKDNWLFPHKPRDSQ